MKAGKMSPAHLSWKKKISRLRGERSYLFKGFHFYLIYFFGDSSRLENTYTQFLQGLAVVISSSEA